MKDKNPWAGLTYLCALYKKLYKQTDVNKSTEGHKDNTKENVSRSFKSTVRTPVRREITRYAFESNQAQVETRRELSLQEKSQGKKGSMSEMVREAIDAYIKRKDRTG